MRKLGTHFITFGSNHLEGFNIKPMKVMLYVENSVSEQHLRSVVAQTVIGKNYCGSYPIEEHEGMTSRWGMQLIELKDLLNLSKSQEDRIMALAKELADYAVRLIKFITDRSEELDELEESLNEQLEQSKELLELAAMTDATSTTTKAS